MASEPKSIRERLQKVLAAAEAAGFHSGVDFEDQKSISDELWDAPKGDFSATDIECVDLSKPIRGNNSSR